MRKIKMLSVENSNSRDRARWKQDLFRSQPGYHFPHQFLQSDRWFLIIRYITRQVQACACNQTNLQILVRGSIFITTATVQLLINDRLSTATTTTRCMQTHSERRIIITCSCMYDQWPCAIVWLTRVSTHRLAW